MRARIERLPLLRKPIFFGWWIAIGAVVMGAVNGAVYAFGLSVFFLPLTEAFDISRVRLSLIFTLANLVQAVILPPVIGAMVDRNGPRRTMMIGVFIMGVGFLLLGSAPSVPLLTVAFMVAAAGVGMGTQAPAHAALINWFSKKRGTAFGIANLGAGIGGMLVVVVNAAIQGLGWRWASVVIALVVWGIGFPIAAMMRHRPEPYGYLPDGTAPAAAPAAGPNVPCSEVSLPTMREIGHTPWHALRSRAFWLINLTLALQSMGWVGTMIHFVPAMNDKGIPSAVAAGLFGLYGVISLPARLFTGIIGDRLQKRYVLMTMSVVVFASMVVLAWSTNVWQVVVFVVLFASGAVAGGSLSYPLLGEYFGRKNIATIMGLAQMVAGTGMALGPILAAWIRETAGSYEVAFLIFGGMNLLGACLMFAAGPAPGHGRRLPSGPGR